MTGALSYRVSRSLPKAIAPIGWERSPLPPVLFRILRENFQFVEFPGNFEAWLDVIIDTRSLAYTMMGSKRGGNLFAVGLPRAPPAMLKCVRAGDACG